MSAKAGKCWLMQANVTNIGQCHLIVKKNSPLGPTPKTKKFESSKKLQKVFKCQVGPFFLNFWMFWTIRDPNLEKINKKKLFSLFPPHHNMAGGQLKKQGFTVNVVGFFLKPKQKVYKCIIN